MPESEEFIQMLSEDLKNRSPSLLVIETFSLCLLMLVTLIGNGCSLYIFFKNPNLLTIPNYFVVALAVSDVLMGLVVMPTAVVNSIHGGNYLNEAYCQVAGFTFCWLASASLMKITAVAFSRFIRVAKPQKYRKIYKKKRVTAMILIIWSIAAFQWVLALSSGKAQLSFLPGRLICFLSFQDKGASGLFPAVFQFVFIFIPSLVISLSYWKLIKAVNKHKFQSNLRSQVSVRQVKITKSILGLVCGFVLCWIPSSTVSHVAFYIEVPRNIQMIFTYFSFLSSAINPSILIASNKDFRKAFLKMFD